MKKDMKLIDDLCNRLQFDEYEYLLSQTFLYKDLEFEKQFLNIKIENYFKDYDELEKFIDSINDEKTLKSVDNKFHTLIEEIKRRIQQKKVIYAPFKKLLPVTFEDFHSYSDLDRIESHYLSLIQLIEDIRYLIQDQMHRLNSKKEIKPIKIGGEKMKVNSSMVQLIVCFLVLREQGFLHFKTNKQLSRFLSKNFMYLKDEEYRNIVENSAYITISTLKGTNGFSETANKEDMQKIFKEAADYINAEFLPGILDVQIEKDEFLNLKRR